jgi:kumamolisin
MNMAKIFVLCCAVAAGCSSAQPLQNARVNPRLLGAQDLGSVSRDAEFQVVLGLRLRQPERLTKLIRDRDVNASDYTPEDFADAFGPSPAEYHEISSWLIGQGFTIVRTAVGRTTITIRGTADTFERVFATPIHRFADRLGAFEAFTAAPRYLPNLALNITGQVGLNGTPNWFSHRFVPTPSPELSANKPLNAWDLEQLYQTATVTGTVGNGTSTPLVANPGLGETIAILGAGGAPTLNGDINGPNGYMNKYQPYGQTALPATGGGYSIVNVGGPNRDGDAAANNEYGENVLDIDMVLAMAPYAKIVHVITATNTPGLFTDGISYIVNQLPMAHSVSVSYGGCERGAAGEMPVLSALMAQAKAQGQQWFFASGDSGTDGCREVNPNVNPQPGANKIISAGWPASDPNVIGVGGTQLTTVGGVLTEAAWVNGGGAPSESFEKPTYQMTGTPNDGARDEPDVAALAGSPYITIVGGGGTASVGGTSAATPIWAGIWALLDQAKGGTGIKNAHEGLYSLGNSATLNNAFNDVTLGQTNGPDGVAGSQPGESAGPKYDLATGWGTPVLPKLIQNWK